jgi:hypothetical protein
MVTYTLLFPKFEDSVGKRGEDPFHVSGRVGAGSTQATSKKLSDFHSSQEVPWTRGRPPVKFQADLDHGMDEAQ